ncbi:MAG: cell division protein ZapE [Hyphomicrobiaceae bacterium]|nr:cell division protein ZapE [Hyphomicrobiaceae bacterium]
MLQGPLETLKARVAAGEMDADPAQLAAAERLGALGDALAAWRSGRRWSLGGLLGGKKVPPPRGLYIHGKVGRGKTMLMDLFFEATRFTPKRRLHFHEFMAETHDRIGAARKRVEGDPIPVVAAEIAQGAGLLCFDELHVTDIADAMILGRLFKGLFERDVAMVATSNVPPSGLYKNGLNRQLFLPSIALIEQNMEVMELVSAKDFRLEKLEGQRLYFTPADAAAQKALSSAFTRLTGLLQGRPTEIDVKGRSLRVPEAARGVARFTFDELCDRPLGSLDYLAIAHRFHTLILSGIPRLVPERRAAARRFINLIDTLYDARVGLIASAEAEPDDLHPAGDESFLFERTASRLIEMRSAAYLESRMERIDATRESEATDAASH